MECCFCPADVTQGQKWMFVYIIYSLCVCVGTHSVSTVGRHVVIVGRISKLDSVLTGFGLTAEGTFSIREKHTEKKQTFTGFGFVSAEFVQKLWTKRNYKGLILRLEEARWEQRKEGEGDDSYSFIKVHLIRIFDKPGQKD